MKMFASLHTLVSALALSVLCVQGSPVRRDVIAPKITSPNAGSVWPVGTTQTVTWDTSNFPPVSQITNIMGKVILGQDANDSLNLDFDHPLAQNFNLTDGSVQITVPTVTPGDNYLIVLFGDSGNTSPDFSITNITVPASTTATSASSTSLISTPIPITGSTITGGDSSSAAPTSDPLTTTTAASADTTTPAATSTAASTSTTASADATGTAAQANSSTASAAWSVHRSGASVRALLACMCAGVALVLV